MSSKEVLSDVEILRIPLRIIGGDSILSITCDALSLFELHALPIPTIIFFSSNICFNLILHIFISCVIADIRIVDGNLCELEYGPRINI